MNRDKVLSFVSLARKAGKCACGEVQTEQAVKRGSAALVILAGDASANTKKKFRNMCAFRRVPFMEYSEKEKLGQAVGKEETASLAITDASLAGAIEKIYRQSTQM